jgi:hypothetical protein
MGLERENSPRRKEKNGSAGSPASKVSEFSYSLIEKKKNKS